LPLSAIPPTPTNASQVTLDKVGSNAKKETSDESTVNPGNLKAKLKTPSISSKASDAPAELTTAPGFRAAEAYVRPSPIATVGQVLSFGFDLRNCVFNLRVRADKAGSEDTPTEVFLPEFHFPKDKCEIEVSSGKWTISTDDSDGGMIQRLRWWHVEGDHTLKVIGVCGLQGLREDEEGYLDQCQQSKCNVM